MFLVAPLISRDWVWSHISEAVFHCEPTLASGESGFRMCEGAVKAWPTGTEMKDFLWERRHRSEDTSGLKISEGCVRQIEYY